MVVKIISIIYYFQSLVIKLIGQHIWFVFLEDHIFGHWGTYNRGCNNLYHLVVASRIFHARSGTIWLPWVHGFICCWRCNKKVRLTWQYDIILLTIKVSEILISHYALTELKCSNGGAYLIKFTPKWERCHITPSGLGCLLLYLLPMLTEWVLNNRESKKACNL